jgi:hypothetical protein
MTTPVNARHSACQASDADPLEPPALILMNASNLLWWLQSLTLSDTASRDAFEMGSMHRLRLSPQLLATDE